MGSEDCEQFDYYVEVHGGYVLWYQKMHKKGVTVDDQLTELQNQRDYMEFEKYERDIKGIIGQASNAAKKKKGTNKKGRKN